MLDKWGKGETPYCQGSVTDLASLWEGRNFQLRLTFVYRFDHREKAIHLSPYGAVALSTY